MLWTRGASKNISLDAKLVLKKIEKFRSKLILKYEELQEKYLTLICLSPFLTNQYYEVKYNNKFNEIISGYFVDKQCKLIKNLITNKQIEKDLK